MKIVKERGDNGDVSFRFRLMNEVFGVCHWYEFVIEILNHRRGVFDD